MKLEVEADKNALERAEKLLAGIPGGITKATYRALNRSLQEGRTAATREATKLYTVKSKSVRESMAMHRANSKNLNAELVSRGKNLPLASFTHRPTHDTTGARRKQVRVGVKKDGLKPLGQGFIHKGQIYQRLGKTSYPIQFKYGLAAPVMLNNEQIVDKVLETMEKSVEKRLEHETNRLLNGEGR